MSRFNRVLCAAMAAAIVAVGGTAASTQEVFCFDSAFGGASIESYHGYSKKPADFGAPGTSTIASRSFSQSDFEFNPVTERCELVGTKNTSSQNYTDGPGNSPYQKRNPISTSCEATGTLSCP